MIFCDNQTREFLLAAIREGAHLKKPEHITDDQWVRKRNILFCYLGTRGSLEEVGKIYHVTRERIRQLVVKALELLWKNCSSELRQRYPLESIPTRKPKKLSLEGYALATAVFNDADPYDLGLPRSKLLSLKKKLAILGVEVDLGETKADQNKEIEYLLRTETDFEFLENLFRDIDYNFYKTHVDIPNPSVISLGRFLRSLDFFYVNRRLRVFERFLERNKIKVGRVCENPEKTQWTYYFIAASQRKLATDILLSSEELASLRQSPVIPIGKDPEGKLPTTTEITKNVDYDSVPTMLREMKILRYCKGDLELRKRVFADCPVTLYIYENYLSYYKPDKNLLRSYFRKNKEFIRSNLEYRHIADTA